MRLGHLRLVVEELRALAERVDTAAHTGRPAEAEAMLQRELDRYPWNDRIAEQLAILLGMRGAWEEALDRLIRALVLGPDDPPRWALLGVVLRELGHEEESRLASSLASIAQ